MIMKHTALIFILSCTFLTTIRSQNYPVYGPEIKVYISGCTTDAMEPFLSPDGNTLFYNSLNNGVDTKLYYATRVDDSTFTYAGEVNGANEPNNPQLNAVASMDTAGNFLWVSVRGYPFAFDNLHRADYSNGTCTNVGRMHGNFYIYAPNNIVMDAFLTYDGSQLIYCNAYIDTCQVPCDASLGIAARVNDTIYNTIPNSAYLMQHVNDTDYCVYAPQLSSDGLTLYFTRYLKGSFNTEICVSVRPTVADTFSSPLVLISEFPNSPEAATINTAGTLMYYHKKANGVYAIYLRYRDLTGIEEEEKQPLLVFPNPASGILNIAGATQDDEITIVNATGQVVLQQTGNSPVVTENFAEGIYFIHVLRGKDKFAATFTICR